MEFADEISDGPGVIAVACRHKLQKAPEQNGKICVDTEICSMNQNAGPTPNLLTNNDNPKGSSTPADDTTSTQSSCSAESDEELSEIESNFEFNLEDLEELGLGAPYDVSSEGDLDSISSCSARESWSNASSEAQSDEIEDEIAWNDWDRDADLKDFGDDHEFLVEMSGPDGSQKVATQDLVDGEPEISTELTERSRTDGTKEIAQGNFGASRKQVSGLLFMRAPHCLEYEGRSKQPHLSVHAKDSRYAS